MNTPFDNFFSSTDRSDMYTQGGVAGATPLMSPLQMQFYTQGQMGYMPQAQYMTPANYGAFRTVPTNTSNLTPDQLPGFFQNYLIANRGNPFGTLGFGTPYLFYNTYNPAVNQNLYMANAIRSQRDSAAATMLASGEFLFSGGVSALGGLAFGPLGLLAGAFAPSLAAPFVDRLRQTRRIQNLTMSKIVGGPDMSLATGMGFSGVAARSLDKSLRLQAAGDTFFKEGDYRYLLDVGLDAGMFDYMNSAQDYKRQLKNLRDLVAGVMDVVGSTDFKDIVNQLKRLRTMGVNDQQLAGMLRMEHTFARMAGLSHADMVNTYGQQGASIYASYGQNAYSGTLANIANASIVTMLKRTGLVSPATLARLGGETGLAQTMTENSAKATQQLTPWLAMMLSNSTGTAMSQEGFANLMQSINNGTFNPVNAMRMSQANINDIKTLQNIMLNKNGIVAQWQEDLHKSDPTGVTMINMLESIGRLILPNGDKVHRTLAAAGQLGLNQEAVFQQIQALVYGGKDMSAQIQRQKVEEDRNRHEQYMATHTWPKTFMREMRKFFTGIGENAYDTLFGSRKRRQDAAEASANFYSPESARAGGGGYDAGVSKYTDVYDRDAQGTGFLIEEDMNAVTKLPRGIRERVLGGDASSEEVQRYLQLTEWHESGSNGGVINMNPFDPKTFTHFHKIAVGTSGGKTVYKMNPNDPTTVLFLKSKGRIPTSEEIAEWKKKYNLTDEEVRHIEHTSSNRGPLQVNSMHFNWKAGNSIPQRVVAAIRDKNNPDRQAAIDALRILTSKLPGGEIDLRGKSDEEIEQILKKREENLSKYFVSGHNSAVNSDDFLLGVWAKFGSSSRDIYEFMKKIYFGSGVENQKQMDTSVRSALSGDAASMYSQFADTLFGSEIAGLAAHAKPAAAATQIAALFKNMSAEQFSNIMKNDESVIKFAVDNIYIPIMEQDHQGYGKKNRDNIINLLLSLKKHAPENNAKVRRAQEEAAKYAGMSPAEAWLAKNAEYIDDSNRIKEIARSIGFNVVEFENDDAFKKEKSKYDELMKDASVNEYMMRGAQLQNILKNVETFDSQKEFYDPFSKDEEFTESESGLTASKLISALEENGGNIYTLAGKLARDSRYGVKYNKKVDYYNKLVAKYGNQLFASYYKSNPESRRKKLENLVEAQHKQYARISTAATGMTEDIIKRLGAKDGIMLGLYKEDFEKNTSDYGSRMRADAAIAGVLLGTKHDWSSLTAEQKDDALRYLRDIADKSAFSGPDGAEKLGQFEELVRSGKFFSDYSPEAQLRILGYDPASKYFSNDRIERVKKEINRATNNGSTYISYAKLRESEMERLKAIVAQENINKKLVDNFFTYMQGGTGYKFDYSGTYDPKNREAVLKWIDDSKKSGKKDLMEMAGLVEETLPMTESERTAFLVKEGWGKMDQRNISLEGTTVKPAELDKYDEWMAALTETQAFNVGSRNLVLGATRLCQALKVTPLAPPDFSGTASGVPGTSRASGSVDKRDNELFKTNNKSNLHGFNK